MRADMEAAALLSPGAAKGTWTDEAGGAGRMQAGRRPLRERLAWSGLVCWAVVATVWALVQRSGPDEEEDASALLRAATDRIISAAAAKAGDDGLYGVYTDALDGAKYVDLTHAFSPDSPIWPGFGPASFGPATAGVDMKGFCDKGEEFSYAKHGFQAGRYTISTDQYGTQLDPPAHWNEFGATISDLPPTFALRPLVVLDIHENVSADAGYHANISDAEAWEKKHGKIPAGSVVMIRSDWYKGWEKYKQDGLPAKYPGVSLELLKWLHNKRKILFHGHEPLDTDMTPTLVGEAWLMHNNFAQAEGLANLDKVPEYGCLLSIGFAKPLGGLGGLARFVAVCPPSAEQGVTVEDAPGAPLPVWEEPLRRQGGVMARKKGAKATEYCKGKGSLGCSKGRPAWK